MEFNIICEGRLSSDLALVKELQEDWHYARGARRSGALTLHEIMSGYHAGNWRAEESENTRVHTVPCLDSFWEAMVSSPLPA